LPSTITLDSCVGVEDFRRHGVLWDYALNDAGAVAKLREEQLAAFAQVIEPASDGNRLAVVFTDFCDGGNRHRVKVSKFHGFKVSTCKAANLLSQSFIFETLKL
jgi:hypothetical protein